MKRSASSIRNRAVHPRAGRRNRRTTTQRTAVPIVRNLSSTLRRCVPWLVGAMAFVGGGIGVHYGWETLCTSSRLQVRKIELVGASRVRPSEIQAYTNIAVGDSILRADLDTAALNLRRHPWVKSARVHRRLPDRLVIEVDEHSPAVVVALGDLYLADKFGHLFKRLSAHDGVVVPLVTGLNRETVATEPDQAISTIHRAVELIHRLEGNGGSLGAVEELHWDVDLGWSVVTRMAERTRPLVTHLGRAPTSRVNLAVKALGTLSAAERVPAELWVDGVKNPGRVQARLYREGDSQQERTLIAKAR